MYILKKNIKRFLADVRSFIPVSKFGIRILLYHSVGGKPQDHPLAVRVSLDMFEKELEKLVKLSYRSVTISEIIENTYLINNHRVIAITFDDGYKDNFTLASIILRKFNLKATFFISTSYIDMQSYKRWSNGQPCEYMQWEEIAKLSGMGFEIGSHMVHHIDLTPLNDTNLSFELEYSKELISKKIGTLVKVFSCPYGKINQRVIEMAKNAGYIGGCSSFSGSNRSDTNKYILKRTEIDGYDTIKDFQYKIQGFYD